MVEELMQAWELPEDDVQAAKRHRLQFRVMFKSTARGRWTLHLSGIVDLREAFNRAHDLSDVAEVGILTSDGFIYWTSRNPAIFNSTIIPNLNSRGLRIEPC